jgi:hypothetical protein
MSFAEESLRWALSGFQIRTPKRIAEIFDGQCSKCPHFNKETEVNGSCGLCGCAIRKDGGGLNKLLWATTQCPDEPPRWLPDVNKKGEAETPPNL